MNFYDPEEQKPGDSGSRAFKVLISRRPFEWLFLNVAHVCDKTLLLTLLIKRKTSKIEVKDQN